MAEKDFLFRSFRVDRVTEMNLYNGLLQAFLRGLGEGHKT
jgi:hypothetical protein